MKISNLVQTVGRVHTALKQMREILDSEDPKGGIVIGYEVVQSWRKALFGIAVLLSDMEIKEIRAEAEE